MDLLQVKVLAETAIPDLRKQGPVEVEEFMRLVIGGNIGVLRQVFGAGHTRRGVDDFLPIRQAVQMAIAIAVQMTVAIAVQMSIGRPVHSPVLSQLCHAGAGRRQRHYLIRMRAIGDNVHDLSSSDEAHKVIVQDLVS